MYAPKLDVIRSGYRDYQPPALDLSSGETWSKVNSAIKGVGEAVDRRYKETQDFYDIQKAETDDLAKFTDGLQGEDYRRMMEQVIASRDKFTNIFKGKKLRDYNTPEFQAQLFEEKKRLGKFKNGIETYQSQIPKAFEYIEKTPSTKKAEAYAYIKQQGTLPPDQRDPDIMATLMTDPLFFNAYDYADSILNGYEKSSSIIQTETPEAYIVTEKKYIPEIGSFQNGKFNFDPSPRAMDALLNGDPRFKNAIIGMMPPDLVKKANDSGNDITSMVAGQAKEFLKTIKSLQPSDEKVDVKNKLRDPKPTAAETKDQNLNKMVNDLQKRLLTGDDNPLQEFLSAGGSSGWAALDVVKNVDGKVVQIKPKLRQYNRRRERVETVDGEPIDVNPDDPTSVRQLFELIRNNAAKSDDAKIQGVKTGSGSKGPTLADKLRSMKKQ